MDIRIGNAGAPRWYDLSDRRLDEYVDRLLAWGAGSAELVLHHGPADERTARVHVLEEEWQRVFERYRARGIVCHVHAPLHPRFKLDRWGNEKSELQAEMRPILRAVSEWSERQGAEAVLVIHGASGEPGAARDATAAFLDWASGELRSAGSGGRLALELRRPLTTNNDAFDRGRDAIVAFIERLGNERVGICWDVGHDWEGRSADSGWTEAPSPRFRRLVNHVHLHDAGGDLDDVHFPLQSERIPWREMMEPLLDDGYRGAITLEVRYRFALSMGDPWRVLGDSYTILRSYLDTRGIEQRHFVGGRSIESTRST